MIMSQGVCQVFGGNVLTYDGLHYEKMSDCVQVLTQDCSEEKKFRVSITESRDVSCLINIVKEHKLFGSLGCFLSFKAIIIGLFISINN